MSLTTRIRGLFQLLLHRGEKEAELDSEVQAYFEMQVDRQVQRGVPIEEARRLVRLNFEGSEQVKEKVRDVRIGAGMIAALRDLKLLCVPYANIEGSRRSQS